MPWFYGIVIGVASGIVTGAIAERLPIPPLVQTFVASLASMVLAVTGLITLWMMLPDRSGSGGIGAVSAGLSEALILLIVPAFFLAVYGLHTALGRFSASAPWIAHHRAIVIACAAGVSGALPVAWVMALVTRATSAE